jgi:hypothetical protein
MGWGSWGQRDEGLNLSSLCEDIAMYRPLLWLLVLASSPGNSARIIGAPPAGQDRPAPARATLAQLKWLAGNWAGATGSATLDERWTHAAGGAMFAVARTIKSDRLAAFEFLRIVERDGSLVYIAQPNGRPPTEFTLTQITADSATFENPSHDFPKMIRYTHLSKTHQLEARVSGAGGERPQIFVFTWVPSPPCPIALVP